jgi:hypothetical protein
VVQVFINSLDEISGIASLAILSMDGIPPTRQAVGPWFRFLLTLALLALPSLDFGQSTAPDSSPRVAVQFKVLDQKTVSFGQHSLTFNRVLPPEFPASRPAPFPLPVPVQPYSNYELLVFFATVYDHRFTVLQRSDGNDRDVAVSNIDFNYLCYTDGFAVGDTFYVMVAFLDNESATDADPTIAGWLAQASQNLKRGTPGYLIVSGTGTTDDIHALNALHSYYAANSNTLVQTYTQKQAQWAEQLLQLKLYPPVRPDTVINYWPIKSSVYPTGAGQ